MLEIGNSGINTNLADPHIMNYNMLGNVLSFHRHPSKRIPPWT